MEENPAVIIHVVDARNLERMLTMTLQLLESGLPVILVLNIMDEAKKVGISINSEHLAKELNMPVVETISTTGKGIDVLRGTIERYIKGQKHES